MSAKTVGVFFYPFRLLRCLILFVCSLFPPHINVLRLRLLGRKEKTPSILSHAAQARPAKLSDCRPIKKGAQPYLWLARKTPPHALLANAKQGILSPPGDDSHCTHGSRFAPLRSAFLTKIGLAPVALSPRSGFSGDKSRPSRTRMRWRRGSRRTMLPATRSCLSKPAPPEAGQPRRDPRGL